MGKASGSSQQVELERKYDVPDDLSDTVPPSFDGLKGAVSSERMDDRHLEAVYYDTPGVDLFRNRITLRRRTGGPDEGWHLKLPGQGEARTEMHAPLAGEVPDVLRDVVLAIVRDRPVMPLARMSTTRAVTLIHGDDGTVLAEFCDDQVTACRLDPDSGAAQDELRWREWELELVDPAAAGDLFDRMNNRLLDAGAQKSGHVSKLAKVLGDAVPGPSEPPADPVHRAVTEQIARLVETDRAVRADAEDAVHQMRVATRQIRSLLQASEDAFGLTDDAWVLSELRELAAVLGTARDAEVLADRYHAALDALETELIRGPVRERLVEGARRTYQAGWRRSINAMRSARYFRLLDALDALAVAQPPDDGDSGRHATIGSSYRKVRKAAKAAKAAEAGTPEEHDHAVHRIRKAAKRLRYIAAATGRRSVERQSKEIQTLLGEHQDSVVSRGHLLQHADAAHAAGEDTLTYGVLYQRELELALRCEEQLGAALKALRRSVG
jgi:CHAD domain-containing protein